MLSNPEAYTESEEERMHIFENAVTQYNNMESLLRPVLLNYKIPHIPFMSYFIKAVDSLFGPAVDKRPVHRGLARTKDASPNRRTAPPLRRPTSTCWTRRCPNLMKSCPDCSHRWRPQWSSSEYCNTMQPLHLRT